MNSRIVAIGSWLVLSALAACGGDDSPGPDSDSGVAGAGGDSGGSGGTGVAGQGGRGGNGGTGGDAPAAEYQVGGELSGLTGKGLVLKLNSTEELKVSANGKFKFEMLLAKGADYSVSVATQPTDPTQACAVQAGTGKVGSADVDNVKITCSNLVKSIGGTVAGLGGGKIVLKNNDGDSLEVGQDGKFSFATPLNKGADYAVTVATPPAGRTCNVTKGSGKVGDDNISDVQVACYANLTLAARARVGSVELSWANNDATAYTIYLTTDAKCDFANADSCADHAKQENVTTPYVWMGLENGKAYYFQVRGSHPNSFETRSAASGARPNRAEFDGQINAIALSGDGTTYVGGDFDNVGTFTGPLAPLDTTTARPTRMPDFPIFLSNGYVSISTVIPDGSGGYFVGGAFELEVGATTLKNLVHVKSDSTIDASWAPDPNGNVGVLALNGSTLYVAGAFTQIGTKARSGLAAISTASTGAATDWDPKLTGSVAAIVANDTTVYVGGNFTSVGSAARANLAALRATDAGALDFAPEPSQPVKALALGSDRLYVAGDFASIGAGTRYDDRGLAALDLTGACLDTFVGAIAPSEVTPDTLALMDGVLYAGGNFTMVDGMARERLVAFNASTGELTSWAPNADDHILTLVASGGTIYAAGDFKNVGGKSRSYLAAIDKQGAVTEWSPRPSDVVHVLAADSNTVYAAGNTVRTFGAEPHAKLASFKGNSLTTWAPAVAGGGVNALAAAGSKVYVGGSFDTVSGVARRGLALLDGNTLTTGFDAHLNSAGTVYALLLNGSRLYVGGVFSDAGGSAHDNIVGLDASSGSTFTGWTLTGAPGGWGVRALALDASTLYVGGGFTTLGASGPSRLGAVNADTGAVSSSFSPGVTGESPVVNALAVSSSTVFVGGAFMTLGGAPCTNLGAVNATGGQVWNGAANGSVLAIVASGETVYTVGAFSTLDSSAMTPKTRLGAAALGYTGENVTYRDWAPGINGTAFALAVDTSSVYLGGDILSVEGNRCRNYITTATWKP